MRIMHTCRSKVDNSGMPIGPCRPRPGSIECFTMPYNLSRGVHQRPKQNTLRILHMEGRHIFGVKPKSLHLEKPDEKFARTWKSLDLRVTKKQSMLHIMGIVRIFGSRVDSLGMPISSCRPRLGSIDRSAMSYSPSRGVHSHPKQNIITSQHLWGETKIASPLKPQWIVCQNMQKFVSPCHREGINVVNNADHAHL
jgi:hypothetical protein